MSMAASITVLAIIVLLLVSAYFSATETALDAASRRRIQKLSRDGNRRAQCVERLQKNALVTVDGRPSPCPVWSVIGRRGRRA